MTDIFKTVVAILIAQWIIYVVSKFSGKTVNNIVSLPEPEGTVKILHKKEKEENLEMPEAVKNIITKIQALILAKKMGV